MLDLSTIDKKLLIAKKAEKSNNIIIFGRITWPKLFVASVNKADQGKPDAKKKYYLNVLLPPESNLKELKEKCQEIVMERWGEKVKTMKIKSPFLKAEDYKYEGHLPGWTFLRLNSIEKPQVVDAISGNLVRITEDDPEIVYGGRWAQISVNPFVYPKAGVPSLGNNGVSIGLRNVKLMNHDEGLGGRIKAEDEFEAPEGEFSGATGGDSTVDDMF